MPNESTKIEHLITKTNQIKNDILDMLKKADVAHAKLDGAINASVVLISGFGEYKLSIDENTSDRLKREWNAWYRQVITLSGDDNKVYQALISINQIINSNWRIHQKDTKEFEKQVEYALDGVIEILNIEQEYEIKPTVSNISSDEITINITTPQLVINIEKIEKIYALLNTTLEKSNIPENEKDEIKSIINEGIENPADIGILKRLSNKFHSGIEKYSPELSVIGTLLGFFESVIGP